MAIDRGLDFVCSWRPENAKVFEVRVERIAEEKFRCSVVNTRSGERWDDSRTFPCDSVFDRCAWRGVDRNGVAGRLFLGNTRETECCMSYVGIDFARKRVRGFRSTEFESTILEKNVPLMGVDRLGWAERRQPLPGGVDHTAEVGMTRFNQQREKETVIEIWENVGSLPGIRGKTHLYLVQRCQDFAFKVLLLGRNSSYSVTPYRDRDRPSSDPLPYDRAELVGLNPDGRYQSVRLWSSAEEDPALTGFLPGRYLSAVPPQEIINYIEHELLTFARSVTDETGRVVGREEIAASECYSNIEVTHVENYEFEERDLECPVLHIAIGRNAILRYTSSPFSFVMNFFKGLFCDQRVLYRHCLEGIDEEDIKRLLTNNTVTKSHLTMKGKRKVFRELDNIVKANATVNLYIATDRSVSKLLIGKNASFWIASTGIRLGRAFAFRPLWESSEDWEEMRQVMRGAASVAEVVAGFPGASPAVAGVCRRVAAASAVFSGNV
jgi:hypothetical protein